MKKLLLLLLFFCSCSLFAQDISVLLKQAINYERALKEDSALFKYKEIHTIEPQNMPALIKSSLLILSAGARLTDKKLQDEYYELSLKYSTRALDIDSNNADAQYAKGFAWLRKSEAEKENKATANFLRLAYNTAAKALAINSSHGRANFLLGKWNFDIINTAWTKKAAIKVLYGSIPDASIDSAIFHMEKCRAVEPYFVLNFLELGKAYKFNNNPAKAIEIFTQLIKLPNRTSDDAGWKAEGKKLLSEMQ